ncbi:hypothetical protein SAY87_020069 [Trapa incisa]|uniref:GATA transcription factor n=2 Tax=Trapa TaxID=22665 RepID=A0AAN7R655_TRANT|nr:hypothetical protein SAY87_020069 [Trapa incisa]KAK4793399.1 hypothetical protein SAY86_023834 [Trapa natans]
MECVEAAALKNSFRGQIFGVRASSQAFVVDEIRAVNVPNGVLSDDFSVDELLDLSNENDFVEEGGGEGEKRLLEEERSNGNASDSCLFEMDCFPAVSAGELSVPADEAADLEWLSHFVEDSSEYLAPFPAGILPEKPRNHDVSGESWAGPERPFFTTPVPAKARSKRTRTGGRVWSLGSPPFLSEFAGSSSSSSPISCTPLSRWLICTDFGLIRPFYGKQPAKSLNRRLKKQPPATQHARRCSHCGIHKTPQWRAGPLGAKTLCNACGVRFKSGRLLPEYRPACSPTFSSELHSNLHRKVLEMRRKKEVSSLRPSPLLP